MTCPTCLDTGISEYAFSSPPDAYDPVDCPDCDVTYDLSSHGLSLLAESATLPARSNDLELHVALRDEAPMNAHAARPGANANDASSVARRRARIVQLAQDAADRSVDPQRGKLIQAAAQRS